MNETLLDIQTCGTLEIPVSVEQFKKFILWAVHTPESNCPIDLKILPEMPPTLNQLKVGDEFYSFQGFDIDHQTKNVVLSYIRKLVVKGPSSSIKSENDNSGDVLQKVRDILYQDHGVTVATQCLEKLKRDNPQLQVVSEPERFTTVLRDLGIIE